MGMASNVSKKIARGGHDSQLLQFVANATPFRNKKKIDQALFLRDASVVTGT